MEIRAAVRNVMKPKERNENTLSKAYAFCCGGLLAGPHKRREVVVLMVFAVSRSIVVERADRFKRLIGRSYL
ncbi:unnamed protein product [Toxocara canis]|uniref:Uncharacterized protein n=1 Tax=Toxocara canis TaxID=6265 RepID=A0A183UQ44_TOXCA|nr:unnamed protein product [Toxocara canis]